LILVANDWQQAQDGEASEAHLRRFGAKAKMIQGSNTRVSELERGLDDGREGQRGRTAAD